MMTSWGSENFIFNECVPWDVLLLKLMHDYHIDEGDEKYSAFDDYNPYFVKFMPSF